MDWPFGDIRPLSAHVIVVDFAWDFSLYSEAGEEKSARAHYDTMTYDEVIEYAQQISYLAAGDCLFLMWGCEWMPPSDRERVLNCMGATYKSTLVWRKVTRKGKVRMSTGYRVRSMHEPIHLGTTGNPRHAAFPSIFDGVARQHSRKPEEFYEMVARHTPGATRLDIFARQSRPGWLATGNEKTKFDGGDPASTKRDRPAREPKVLEPMALFPDAA